MAHIHAHMMMEYAKDAMETDKPWERWEYSYEGQEYTSLQRHPEWFFDTKYRRKPKTIMINGYDVPEPQRVPLKDGEEYWTLTLSRIIRLRWFNDEDDRDFLKRGIVHLTKEAAEKHREAITSFTMKK